MSKPFTNWAKTYKNDSCRIFEISEEEAMELIKKHIFEADIRKRIESADQDNPIRCGIWLVWGWSY